MSTQCKDSHHEATPQDTINTKVLNFEIPKHMDSSTTNVSMPDTKIAQGEQDGKPSITFTSYNTDFNSLATSNSRPLVHLFKPIAEDGIHNYKTHNLTSASHVDEHQAVLAQLSAKLEAHFGGLKSEFQVKRGKSWSPLRAWPKEEWEWSDDGSAEEEDAFDWC
jgi:hypothetical protein